MTSRSQLWACPSGDCTEGDCECDCGETLTKEHADYDHLCGRCSYLSLKC